MTLVSQTTMKFYSFPKVCNPLPETLKARCALEFRNFQILSKHYSAHSIYHVKLPVGYGDTPYKQHINISATKYVNINTNGDKQKLHVASHHFRSVLLPNKLKTFRF